MTETQGLVIGFMLLLISAGALAVCYPRGGRKAWFVDTLFVESGVSILIVTCFCLGLILIAGYFTGIDEATLTGMAKAS